MHRFVSYQNQLSWQVIFSFSGRLSRKHPFDKPHPESPHPCPQILDFWHSRSARDFHINVANRPDVPSAQPDLCFFGGWARWRRFAAKNRSANSSRCSYFQVIFQFVRIRRVTSRWNTVSVGRRNQFFLGAFMPTFAQRKQFCCTDFTKAQWNLRSATVIGWSQTLANSFTETPVQTGLRPWQWVGPDSLAPCF